MIVVYDKDLIFVSEDVLFSIYIVGPFTNLPLILIFSVYTDFFKLKIWQNTEVPPKIR